MSRRKQLLIIDGHSLAFRAFHAFTQSDLRTSSGEPTYAVYGFAQILLTLIQERHPDYVAVAFDIGPTFRHELYAEYKAGRAETPAEFHPQLDRIKELLQRLSIPVYVAEGYEADDVIGTLARQATGHDIDTLILTGDTDTLQLVDEHVTVIMANPYGQKTRTTHYTVEKVRERYKGLSPGQLTDLRGLKGDASDNIPGVKGIGEGGAIALLTQFGTVEEVYAHLEGVPKRYQKHLAGQEEQALFSKRLAIIACDVPVKFDIEAASIGHYDRSAIIDLFHELEFGSSMVTKLPTAVSDSEVQHIPRQSAAVGEHSSPPQTRHATGTSDGLFFTQQAMFGDDDVPSSPGDVPPPTAGHYQSVTTEETLQEVIAALTSAPHFAFDTETSSLNSLESELVGISLAVQPGRAWYIPIGHNQGIQLDRQQVLNALRPFFRDPHKAVYAHNARFDVEVMLQAGIQIEGLQFDTMIAAGLLGKRKELKDLAFYELKLTEPMQAIESLIGRGAKQRSFAQVAIEHATPYASADADVTLRLKEALEPQLAAEERIHEIFTRMEMPLIPVLVDMERAGIRLDVACMRDLSKRFTSRIATITEQIYDMAGQSFNINSGLQLNTILFDKLGLPTTNMRKTSTGRISLAADVLENLRGSHEIVEHILQYRHFFKLKSTYVDALPTLVNPRTGRIHTSFNQMGTSTGRLSSANPNLQNIPIRSEDGGEIRRGFVAEPGHTFIAADYSQIELRVLAHITQDPNLVQAFIDGQDIHTATAAQLFGIDPSAVGKDQRRIAKSVVFGTIYGISSFGLAQRTDLNRTEAKSLIDAFFARFPGVRRYMDSTIEQGRRDGYVQSLFGRRRWMPELKGNDQKKRQAAEREAINAPIQATAADIMKLAMINVYHELQQQRLQTRLLLQVHDELIFEVPDQEIATVQELVRTGMERVFTLRVPLQVDMEMGHNWEDMEAIA